MHWQTAITAFSSVCLRSFTYIYLRWIPGPLFPPIITALFAIYLSGYAICVITSSPFDIIDDRVDVITKPISNGKVNIRRANGESKNDLGHAHGPIEELDVTETITLGEKDPHVLTTIITGLPSPTSIFWSAITFIVNVVLVIGIYDFTYRSALLYPAHDLSFARVGYVSDTTAKLLVREPDVRALPIRLSYRYADKHLPIHFVHSAFDTAWNLAGEANWLTDETDFTAKFTIKDLTPDTRYQYAFSNNHSGFFVTAPTPGKFSSRDVANDKLTFLHTSCIVPHFPYNPMDHPLTIPGFSHLSRWLSRLKPAFMLFLGDFIYIDVPHRHGSDVATYRREYRQVYASPSWPSVATTSGRTGLDSASVSAGDTTHHDIPWLHVYDDHEIANDWWGNISYLYPAAFDPYNIYHLSLNPPSPFHSSPSSTSSDIIPRPYTAFTHGPATFFILDARRYRTPPNLDNPSDPTRTILGADQLSQLLLWLAAPLPPGVRWKFLITSVPFTKNWRVNAADTWAGYLYERRLILEAMWDYLTDVAGGSAIVILSGDRHEFAATSFPPPADDSRWAGIKEDNLPIEFSCSPLNMFYVPVRTYAQRDEEDVCIKYLPEGNSKFSAVEISATGSGQGVLTYRLFVDGQEAWSHVLTVKGDLQEGWRGGARDKEGVWS